MAPKVALHYFPLRGRGEIPRLMLAAGGVAHEEVVVTFDEWPKKKSTYPFGVTPVLYWDGEEISQSMTVSRFIARKTGLSGSNDEEFARSDTVAENVNDMLIKYWDYRFNNDEAKKKEAAGKYVNELVANFLKSNEAFVKKHGGKFVNGKALSYGDIALFHLLDMYQNKAEMTASGLSTEQYSQLTRSLESHPTLIAIYSTVKSCPKMAAYLKKRTSAGYSF